MINTQIFIFEMLNLYLCIKGFSPLHHACNRGHSAMVFELLRLCVPIDVRNDSLETPLHLAVYSGNLLIVDQLLGMEYNSLC